MTQIKIDAELLITLVENRPIVWDKTYENYKDKILRTAVWREICISLKDDFEAMDEKERQNYAKAVVKKWNQLRDSWMRSLNVTKSTKKSGSGSVRIKKYCYHNQMLFLKKIINPAETHDRANSTEINKNNSDTEDSDLENTMNQNKDNRFNDMIPEMLKSNQTRISNQPTSSLDITFEEKAPPPKKQRMTSQNKNDRFSMLFEAAEQILTNTSATTDDYEIMGRSIGIQLKDISKKQLFIVQKLISDVIYYGKLGKLTDESAVTLSNSFDEYQTQYFQAPLPNKFKREDQYSSLFVEENEEETE